MKKYTFYRFRDMDSDSIINFLLISFLSTLIAEKPTGTLNPVHILKHVL